MQTSLNSDPGDCLALHSGKEILHLEETCLLDITAADVADLVDILKCKVTLQGLNPHMWTEQCVEKLQTFILSLNHNQMTCCLQCDPLGKMTLQVELQVPMTKGTPLVYFVKNPALVSKVVTVQTFLSAMSYGTINANVIQSLQGIFRFLFGPHFHGSIHHEWPPDFVNTFLRKYHNLISSMFSVYDKQVLYIPEIGNDIEIEQAMEDLVLQWILALEVVVGKKVHLTSQHNQGLLGEFAEWSQHLNILKFLQSQLTTSKAKQILELTCKSPFTTEFHKLLEKLEEEMDLINTVLCHLSILIEPCEAVKSSNLHSLQNHFDIIINCVRIIWTNSPNYNSDEKITGLFVKLGFEIVNRCKEIIMQGEAEKLFSTDSANNLKAAILCCQQWREHFIKAENVHRKLSKAEWNIEEDTCMKPTEAFIQRCRDLLQIYDCCNLYCEKKTNSGQFETLVNQKFQKLRSLFHTALLPITINIDTALDVGSAEWHSLLTNFMEEIGRLDAHACNIIWSLSEKLKSVKGQVQLLQVLKTYASRETFQQQIVELAVDTQKMYHGELIEMQKEFAEKTKHLMPSMSTVPGEFFWIKGLQQRVTSAMNWVQMTTEISGKQIASDVECLHHKMSTCLEIYKSKLLERWNENAALIDWTSLSVNPLIRYSQEVASMMEPNVNPSLVKLSREAKIWKEMNLEMGASNSDISEQWEKISVPYNNVIVLTQNYNRIITSLSEEELQLFSNKIDSLKVEFSLGITFFKWARMDLGLQNYFKRCHNALNAITAIILEYKSANAIIEEQCSHIKASLLAIPICRSKPISFEEYYTIQSKNRQECAEVIRKCRQEIMSATKTVADLFLPNADDCVEQHVQNYLKEVNREELGNYLQNIRESFKCTRDMIITPNTFQIHMSIEGKLKVTPSPSVVSLWMEKFCKSLSEMENEELKLPHESQSRTWDTAIATDAEISRLEREIMQVTHEAVKKLEKYIEEINMRYEDVWISHPTVVLKNYAASADEEIISEDCAKFHQLEQEIKTLETKKEMHFLSVDASDLQGTLLDYCMTWKNELAVVIFERIQNKLQVISTRIQSCTVRQPDEVKLMNENAIQELSDISKQLSSIRRYGLTLPQDLIGSLRSVHQIRINLMKTQKFENLKVCND